MARKLSVLGWAPLNEAFARIKAALDSSTLASRDLLDLLRGGRLTSAVRRIARDGTETSGELEPSFWQLVTLQEGVAEEGRTGKVVVRFIDSRAVAPFSSWYFVARRNLDALYPAVGARADHDDDSVGRIAEGLRVDTAPPARGETPKRKSNPSGRHRSLTPEQIENGISILRKQPRMTVEAARATLRDAGINGSDSALYRLIIAMAYASR